MVSGAVKGQEGMNGRLWEHMKFSKWSFNLFLSCCHLLSISDTVSIQEDRSLIWLALALSALVWSSESRLRASWVRSWLSSQYDVVPLSTTFSYWILTTQFSNLSLVGSRCELSIFIFVASSQWEGSQCLWMAFINSGNVRAASSTCFPAIQSQMRAFAKHPWRWRAFWSSAIPPLTFKKKHSAHCSNSCRAPGVTRPSDIWGGGGRVTLGWVTTAWVGMVTF